MPVPPTPTPEKRCEMCGKHFKRVRFESGRLEDRSAYLKRQFCSLSCSNSRLKGGLSRKAFHAQARKHVKPACECCGATKFRHVHHVDEDWTNNDLKNLQTLCVFCHQFWHATHLRVGVKPSRRMPSLRSHLRTVLPIECFASEATVTRSTHRQRKPSSKARG